jgi:hypothetical protein
VTKYEAGYLQALGDVQEAVRVFTDETRSPNGKFELLGVLSLLGKLIDITDAGDGGERTANPANENAEAGAE